jgi:hypothetical protein
MVSASLAHSFRQAENPMSEDKIRERIKRQIGEFTEQDEIANEIIQMPIDGSIVLTVDSAEKLSKILDKKLKKKRSFT